eukprot:TRINITY_DN13219_c0_g1_i1.p1 TRINITY_DN13219_c0_g1~~TRINITY_DN13219_c0_g1_i1.p1  ORF type:complete len:390 (+),score=46.36 TRINITY_DN13219_c0_g1_i1:30-1199(+)
MLSASCILENVLLENNSLKNIIINNTTITVPVISLSETNLGTPFFMETSFSKTSVTFPWDICEDSLRMFVSFITNTFNNNKEKNDKMLISFVDVYRMFHFIDSPLRHKLTEFVTKTIDVSNLLEIVDENSPTDLDMLGSLVITKLKNNKVFNISIEGDVIDVENNKLILQSNVMSLLIPEWNPSNLLTNLSVHLNIKNCQNIGCLAGGFVLQSLLGEQWCDSDIDMFVSSYESHLEIISRVNGPIKKVERLGIVTNVITEDGKVIQLIKTDNGVPEVVFKKFDLAMCQCSYYNNAIEVTGLALKSMISRSCYLKGSRHEDYVPITLNYKNRLFKYINRGFSIFLDDKLLKLSNIENINIPRELLSFSYKEDDNRLNEQVSPDLNNDHLW